MWNKGHRSCMLTCMWNSPQLWLNKFSFKFNCDKMWLDTFISLSSTRTRKIIFIHWRWRWISKRRNDKLFFFFLFSFSCVVIIVGLSRLSSTMSLSPEEVDIHKFTETHKKDDEWTNERLNTCVYECVYSQLHSERNQVKKHNLTTSRTNKINRNSIAPSTHTHTRAPQKRKGRKTNVHFHMLSVLYVCIGASGFIHLIENYYILHLI